MAVLEMKSRLHHISRRVKRVVGRWSERRLQLRTERRKRRVAAILARNEPYSCYDEALFDRLQRRYPPRPEYGYDPKSTWWRGNQRAEQILSHTGLVEPGARVLEVGCGDGMTGQALSWYGHQVTLTDLADWRDERALALPFVPGDLCGSLDLAPGTFDLICSFNAFEHIEQPGKALAELCRLCRKGGLIYLDFGPLYASPWGLHAYRSLYMPYPQFLFTPEFIDRKLAELGIYDLGERRSTLQPMNRWRLRQFDQLWEASGCERVLYRRRTNDSHLALIERFPLAFTGRGLTLEDVTTGGLLVILRKR